MRIFLFEAVIGKLSTNPEKFLWLRSSTTISTLRPEHEIPDFIALSTLGITKVSITVITALCFLYSNVVITMFTSQRTLLVMFFSGVCMSIWEPLIWSGLFVFINIIISPFVLFLFSFWFCRLFCPIRKSASDLINRLSNVLLCCLFQVKATLKSSIDLKNFIKQNSAKIDQKPKMIYTTLAIQFWRFWKQLDVVLSSFQLESFFSRQLLVVFLTLIFGSASNRKTSFHDITTVSVTATRAVYNLKKIPNLHFYMTSLDNWYKQ